MIVVYHHFDKLKYNSAWLADKVQGHKFMHTRFIYWIYLLLMEWLLYITTNWRIMIQWYLIFTLVMNFKSVWLTCTVQLGKFMSDIGYFSVSILRGFGEKKIMAVAVSTKKELWLGQCPWKDLRLSQYPWWNSFPKYLGRLWWLVNNKNEQKKDWGKCVGLPFNSYGPGL